MATVSKDRPDLNKGNKGESFVEPVSESSEEIENYVKKKLKEAMSRSSRAKREFFTGIKFQIRIDTIEFRVHSSIREIIEFKTLQPNLHVKFSNICLKAGFTGPDLAIQFTIREISAQDYFRNEGSQAVVHWASG